MRILPDVDYACMDADGAGCHVDPMVVIVTAFEMTAWPGGTTTQEDSQDAVRKHGGIPAIRTLAEGIR